MGTLTTNQDTLLTNIAFSILPLSPSVPLNLENNGIPQGGLMGVGKLGSCDRDCQYSVLEAISSSPKMSLGPVFLLSHPKVCVPGLAGSEVYGIWLFAA